MTPSLIARIRLLAPLAIAGICLLLSGCATYQTPGAGADLGALSKADGDIAERMQREPAATFPARLAIARVQASGYSSRSNQCYGKGEYCIVTTRDVESDQDFEWLGHLPMVAAVAPINRLLVPTELHSLQDLRLGAASLKTDLLLVYSIDTKFNAQSTEIGPLALISLGFLPNKKASVTSTASAALFDVRTGFVYGAAEATASEQQRATIWSSEDAIERSRVIAESEAFRKLLVEFDKLWRGVVSSKSPAASSVKPRDG